MKYLLTKDIDGAEYGRIVANESGVLIKGHKFDFPQLIDLGLTSKTLWYDRNIGAKSPTDAGLYFQWGDTQGYTADQCGTGEGQKEFTWNDYKFGTSSNLSKYNTNDNKLKLDPEDDAAVKLMGGDFHMPTKDQFDELFKETIPQLILSDDTEIDGAWDTENDYFAWNAFEADGKTIKGLRFTSKVNGNKLFFPASGILADGSVLYVGAGGGFWSASRYESSAGSAWSLNFGSDGAEVGYFFRYGGLPVRGVVGGGVASTPSEPA